MTRRRAVALGALAVAAGWVAGWLARRGYGSPNVDDYLYTTLARDVRALLAAGHLRGAAGAVLGSGPFAPLVPLLAVPLAPFGPDGAVLVQLPILLGLYAVTFLLLERRTEPPRAALLAAATCLSPPVLGWSLMLHMALLATLCALAAVEAFLRSDGWARLRPAALCGLAAGLLSLSRSMAPVYVAALVVALGVATWRGRRVSWRGVALAAGVAAAVAGPWWVVSGPETLRYLTSAGYDASTSFVGDGNPVVRRALHLVHEWGLAAIALVVAGLAAALARRRATTGPGRALLAFAGLTLLALATTGNRGTAFALPVLPALVVAVAPGRVLTWGLPPLALAGVVTAVLPALPARPVAPPAVYAEMARAAAGDSGARSGPLHRELAERTLGAPVLVVRDDAVVNVNGLVDERAARGVRHGVSTPPYVRSAALPDVEPHVGYVVAGTSCVPYHAPVDQAALAGRLTALGFRLAWQRRLSACNLVELWERPGLP